MNVIEFVEELVQEDPSLSKAKSEFVSALNKSRSVALSLKDYLSHFDKTASSRDPQELASATEELNDMVIALEPARKLLSWNLEHR